MEPREEIIKATVEIKALSLSREILMAEGYRNSDEAVRVLNMRIADRAAILYGDEK